MLQVWELHTYTVNPNEMRTIHASFPFCRRSVTFNCTHIPQGYFTGTGAIIWLPQCQWSNPEKYRWTYFMNLKWAVCTAKTKQNITKSFACLMGYTGCKDRSVHAPSQWEMTLHCNVFSHLLGAYMKWSLWMYGLFSVSLKKVQMSHVITLINSLSPSRCVKKILKFNNFGNYFYIFPEIVLRWSSTTSSQHCFR